MTSHRRAERFLIWIEQEFFGDSHPAIWFLFLILFFLIWLDAV